MLTSTAAFLLLFVTVVLADDYNTCIQDPGHPRCRHQNWIIKMQSVRPSGVVVQGQANFPVHQSPSANTQGTVHGSHVFGGPYSGAQTVGGGLNYQHSNGLHGVVDATHTRGMGNTFSGSVGGSTQVGPGTLSVGGGASTIPGSSRVQGQVGATYTAPLP